MLYLVKSNSAIKIGSAEDVKKRMIEYKTHNPDFELLDIANGTIKEEKELHYKLKDYSYKNLREWFIDCDEVRKVWNDYILKNGKCPEYYVEYCKPYTRRLTEDALLKFGLFKDQLYGEPLYNIVTGETYKHIQEWIEKEKLGEDSIYNLFLYTNIYPIVFVHPERIYPKFEVLKSCKTMKEVYEESPFNLELYLSNKKHQEERNKKKIERDLKKFNKCPKWITDKLEKDKEYSFEELENMFKPVFEEKNLDWNKSYVIRYYFPNTVKRYTKRINNISTTYYTFNIF